MLCTVATETGFSENIYFLEYWQVTHIEGFLYFCIHFSFYPRFWLHWPLFPFYM